MITIVASYNVTPNQPTPSDPIWLSDSDQIGHLRHVNTIYAYKSRPNNTIDIERMKNSLSKILVPYYPIAGRLKLTKNGRMEVDCNAKGVTLIEAESTATFGDYGDFAPSDSTMELVPKVDYTRPSEDMPLMLVQLTRFCGGEGLAIGVAFSHPLVDGTAAIFFINRWAKLVRGEELDPNEVPFLDRTLLKFPEPSEPCVDLPEWKPVRFMPDNIAEQNKISAILLKLSSSQVEKLKKKANEQPSKEGVRPYSRFEAISSHIWRCASKAHHAHASDENHQPTVVTFSVDIRNRLNPPLPQNYFGNALAKTLTPKCSVGDILLNPLSYGAQKIRDAVYAVTYEYIRSHISYVLGQEQLDNIRAFFSGQGDLINEPYSGNPHNILITSWMSLPVYDADFGWGKPVHFGLAKVFREVRAHIIISPDGDGVLISMNFLTALMDLFKKFFYEDI
ncbi:hypothetical protein AAZX31_10G057400 [Glycine max]|uniref:Uncharacterized protein n=2 Tax=Glycine subgen. Soja TaxID=1462606 RepID=I1L924_SOYBN|nr:spermidine hydroxycinnamoyl transferase [Glycine max]XP_028182299.1 spermidine hydroxycinnamoyl transferase-like [Glycine soja]KAG4996255.1 hypothetical protein JHK85_027694 [Glycine max]KAG5003053.1 hypothetical protein JHK86_027192 [Glycine max]KAG5126230.1 hypothetical protein JHK82_027065 [Glycine max]KAG5150830.1 hypothetical protein JHK84_027302 [Glycine max]KAH1137014.1 hypothetical protein GYH30_027124 [Glycine max]|eukprot:XP_003535207.1 spermidine hydroxycinnamoyl transferase [Glycine max]